MSGLRPTKTRLELLRAVADGRVWQHYPLLPEPVFSDVDCGLGVSPRWVKVTRAVHHLKTAGWIALGAGEGSWSHEPRRWHLTDAGRAVLDGDR